MMRKRKLTDKKLAIKEMENEIHFEFYHCKYAHGNNPGGRLSDLYEVCGQAYLLDTYGIVLKLICSD